MPIYMVPPRKELSKEFRACQETGKSKWGRKLQARPIRGEERKANRNVLNDTASEEQKIRYKHTACCVKAAGQLRFDPGPPACIKAKDDESHRNVLYSVCEI